MCPTDHFQRNSTTDDDDDAPDARHTTHDDDDARAMWGPTGARARTMMRTCVHRAYAATGAAKPAAQHDVVQRVFVEQQQKFRALLEKTKTLTPPIGGDATAVKAYAAKKMAILKEVRACACAPVCVRHGGVVRARVVRWIGKPFQTIVERFSER